MIEFWKHSLAVAVTSMYSAQKSGGESADNCFVGGLLHDVGKVTWHNIARTSLLKSGPGFKTNICRFKVSGVRCQELED